MSFIPQLDPNKRRPSFLTGIQDRAVPSWKRPDKPNPMLSAASNVANVEQSLRAVGETPLQPEKSWWQSGLEHLARPGAATRSALEAARNKGDIGSAFGKGWNEPSSAVTGEQQLEQLGQSNVPVASAVAKYLGQSGLGRFIGGTALEIAQDPTTFIGAGTQRIPGVAGAAAKRLTLAGKYVGPDLSPVGAGLSSLANVVPGVKGVREAVGQNFNAAFVPFGASGQNKQLLPQAYQMIHNFEGKLPQDTLAAQKAVIDEAAAAGITRQSAEGATSLIESLPASPGQYNQLTQIGKINASAGSPEEKVAAVFARKSYDADIALANKLGLKADLIDNYTYHRYRNPPQQVQAIFAQVRTNPQSLNLGADPSFAKKRVIENLDVARSIGLDPYTDIRTTVAAHRAEAEKMVAYHNLLLGPRGLQSLGPTVIGTIPHPGWVNVGKVPSMAGYQIGDKLWVYPEVARHLANLAPMISNASEGRVLADQIHGTAMKYFKAFTLFTPAFYSRNTAGATWLNIADGVVNPLRYAQGAVAWFAPHLLPEMNIYGKVWKTQDLVNDFKSFSLQGQGIFHEVSGPGQYASQAEHLLRQREVPLGQRALEAMAPSAKHPLAPITAPMNAIFTKGRQFGEASDSYMRFVNWLHHLDLGEPMAQAAQSTRNAQFDYGSLTATERNIRQYLIPFYPWMRYNLPKQLELLISNPKMATGTETLRRNAVSATGTDEANLPTWMRESGAIPIGHPDYQSTAYATLNLPLYDLQNVHDPADVQAMMKRITQTFSPFITMIPQLATNTVAYSGAPITDTPDLKDQAMRDYLRFITKQLTGGVGRAYDQAISEEERQRRNLVKESRGLDVPPTVPRIAGPLGTFFAVNVQSQPLQAASAILDRQNLLAQQKKVVEARLGKALPLSPEIAREKTTGSFIAGIKAGQLEPPRIVPAGPPGTFLTGGPRIEAGQSVAVVQRAVEQAGVGRDWEPYLNLVLQKENRKGDPTAVNPTPVLNTWTRPGQPFEEHAKGLFQMLPSTFAANAALAAKRNPEPFQRGLDIMDPTQNILAAIERIRSTYGHPSQIPNLTYGTYRGY